MLSIKTSKYFYPRALNLVRTTTTIVTDHQDLAGVKSFDEVPGPKPIPILGNLWRFFPIVGTWSNMNIKDLVQHLNEEYGDIVKLTGLPGRKKAVYIFKPEDVQAVFRHEGKWPIRDAVKSLKYYRTVLRKDMHQGIDGVITSQGKAWQEFRSKVNQPMMQPRSAKLYVSPINDVAGDFIDRMKSFRNSEQELPRDFINELYKWSLESIATVTLDTRLGCLAPNLKPDSEPQKMIDAVQVLLDGLYFLDMRPSIWRFISTPMWRKFVKSVDYFTEVSLKHINEAMERIKKKPIDNQQELSMLERLLLNNDNPMVASVMVIDMLFGGVDTTSHTSAILLFNLAKNPDKQQKLYEEVKRLLPDSKSQPITQELLNEMKYLRACLKESMRVHPITFGNLRELAEDVVLSNYLVPKGTDAFMCHQLMTRMEKHFPQPERFIPERWIKGNKEYHTAHPFTYMPFGFGTRMCVGRRFAELEILILVAKVIRHFRVEYNEGDELTFQSRAINMVTSPLNFKMVDRPN